MRTRTVLAAAAVQAVPIVCLAQPCTTGFQPGGPGAVGISDPFSAYAQPMTFFQSRLIVGGAFSSAGGLATNCIGAYDPGANTWSRLGAGADLGSTNGYGAALATFTITGSPMLIFGGSFAAMKNTNGVSVAGTTSLAAWNGTQWSSLGTGWTPATGRSVWSLLDWQPSPGVHRLVAGGGFPSVGTATAAGIAVFDGESWSNIGGPTDTGIAGTFSPTVFVSAVYAGQLYIGGRFDSVNGVASPLVARWSGTAWERPGALAAGSATSDCSSMCLFNDGTGDKLYAGGADMRVGGIATTVAVFNGTTWSRVGQNLGGRGTGLAGFDDGGGSKLYMGMTADAQQKYIYRLEGTQWAAVDNGVSVAITGNFPSVFGLLASGSTLYVGGNFQSAGGEVAHGIAQYGPCPQSPCAAADFTHDGHVLPDDVAFFVATWLGDISNGTLLADFDHNGQVQPADVAGFVAAWLAAIQAGC